MRMGWFRPVHVKTLQAQEIRALLTARKLLVAKLRDIESSTRGILRGFVQPFAGVQIPEMSTGEAALGRSAGA